MLISGTKVHGVSGAGGAFHFDFGDNPSESMSGTATAITADGYYLTAAHMVEKLPLTVINLDEQQSRVAEARIVWKSASRDVAVIIDASPSMALRSASSSYGRPPTRATPSEISSSSWR